LLVEVVVEEPLESVEVVPELVVEELLESVEVVPEFVDPDVVVLVDPDELVVSSNLLPLFFVQALFVHPQAVSAAHAASAV
jgi:hypothetical protein